MNTVYLIGNLGRDPEMRQTNGGQAVATLSIATTKNVKIGQEWQGKTTWHSVVAFGKRADRLAQLRKGEMVFVDGEIVVEQWTSKDGQARSSVKIHANRVVRVDDLRSTAHQSQPSSEGNYYNDPSYSTPPF